jgi:signal transduction histidine kinase
LFAGVIPLLVGLAGATTWKVTGRSLRPVAQIRARVDEITGTDLHLRVPEPATSDEIAKLAQTMNNMLGRLDEAATQQRQFIADASHELRSPVAALRTQLEVAQLYPERYPAEESLSHVSQEVGRLHSLIDDLLSLARLDARATTSEPFTAVDLDDVVFAVTGHTYAPPDIAIDTAAVSGAQLQGDLKSLERMVRNLVDNACRHASSRVTLRLSESNNAVALEVEDDGGGIPPEFHQTIFERFSRLDNARDRDSGGSGLGLAIVNEIVRLHHGTISIHNTPGACFRIVFPAA